MPKANKKAAIYCRVSTLHQIDKDSLPMQKNDMINYAKYALNIEDYDVFEDAGYSGKNMDRPAFQAMMERVHRGEFTHILVWKIDRISRNLLDFANMYEQCKKIGVTFISKNEQFDTSTAMGEAMLKIILVFAELERNMTSERVSATMNARAADGKWNGGRVPYGYSYDKKTATFSIREDEAAIVRRIYDIYASTHSLVQTTTAVNDAGWRSRRGFKWTPSTIRIILSSPFYLGTMRYNYQDESTKTFSFKNQSEWILVENHHVPMISKEQYDICNYWLQKNNRSKLTRGSHMQQKNTHIFAGLIHCGACGSTMVATLDRMRKDGYRPSMYQCYERRQSHRCKNIYVNDITIGNFVFSYISNMLQLRKSFQTTYQKKDLQRILLHGDEFINVKSIVPSALSQLLLVLQKNAIGINEYKYNETHSCGKSDDNKRESRLKADIAKRQRALSRLDDLYLFSDESMPQKDYLQKKLQLSQELNGFQQTLNELKKNSVFSTALTDEKFIEKASALLLNKSLQKTDRLFPALAMQVGNKILKDFANATIADILVKDGKVTQIEFRNGIAHAFNY